MRAGLSTIQQTLTPDSASILTRSIADAARRSHAQTTPLHVAATLLSAPAGMLRQACIRSHPASSHPLQCRALELCFTVALDRLPSVNSNNTADPPISNALMAALKRAQAHQRRGCPEQQQQPLLAVKVELEQLIISILDDPSVSRVMREASFSSPAVKASIEQSLTSASNSNTMDLSSNVSTSSRAMSMSIPVSSGSNPSTSKLVSPINRNLYMNPRLQQAGVAVGNPGVDEARRVLDIMMRSKKRNPVVVSDTDPGAVMKAVMKRINSGEAPVPLTDIHLISLDVSSSDRSMIPSNIRELGSAIESRIGEVGVVLDLGDLKWLVESPGGAGSNPIQQQQQQQQIVSETGRAAVAEMSKILQRFADSRRLWVVATASCATYLRCQVYHPTMDSDWDLQALPIAPRSPLPIMLTRHGGNGILSSSVETLAPPKGFPVLGTSGGASSLRRPIGGTELTASKTKLCAICMGSYEKELAALVSKQFEKSSVEATEQSRPALPHWMKAASTNLSKPQEPLWKQSTEELLKSWRENCSKLHPTINPGTAFPPCRPQPTRLAFNQTSEKAGNIPFRFLNEQRPRSPPKIPVQTDLVLGQDKDHRNRLKDFTACKPNEFSDNQGDSFDSFKRLYKGLAERVGWQPAAATAVATVVTQCKSGKPRGTAWLMFVGPDKVGKRKMASALSDLVFNAAPVTINLVADDRQPAGGRGRGMTAVDRISDAVRRNPFSVVVLEGFDRADLLVRGSIKRAIQNGRLVDSQGREVSLGSVVFVLNTDWLPEELKNSHDSNLQCEEERIVSSAGCGWQLEFSVIDRTGKRSAECNSGSDQSAKKRKVLGGGSGLSLDLNLAAGMDDDNNEVSPNSSELTVEHEQERPRLGINSIFSNDSSTAELKELVDGTIEFKPIDFSPIRRKVLESINAIFNKVMGNGRFLRVDDDALDTIVGGVWLTGAGIDPRGFEEWAEKVLVPTMQQLNNSNFMTREGLAVVRLSAVKDPRQRQWTSSLPSTVSISGVGS